MTESSAGAFSEPVEVEILRRWKAKNWASPVWTDYVQELVIKERRTKYIFPDYLDLISPPKPEHYAADGELTLERKRQLLLIGVFAWKGLFIAINEQGNGKYEKGWRVVTDPDYDSTQELKLYADSEREPLEKDEQGWYVVGRSGGKRRTTVDSLLAWDDNYFDPFHDYEWIMLREHLGEAQGLEGRIVHADIDKPYDCSPQNLVVAKSSLRAYVMLCKACGGETDEHNSERIKVGDRSERYCLSCIGQVASEPTDKPGRYRDPGRPPDIEYDDEINYDEPEE